jgi:hypothetical protein
VATFSVLARKDLARKDLARKDLARKDLARKFGAKSFGGLFRIRLYNRSTLGSTFNVKV